MLNSQQKFEPVMNLVNEHLLTDDDDDDDIYIYLYIFLLLYNRTDTDITGKSQKQTSESKSSLLSIILALNFHRLTDSCCIRLL